MDQAGVRVVEYGSKQGGRSLLAAAGAAALRFFSGAAGVAVAFLPSSIGDDTAFQAARYATEEVNNIVAQNPGLTPGQQREIYEFYYEVYSAQPGTAGFAGVPKEIPGFGPSITPANNTVGWKVGDPINNLTAAGNVPAWSTVRKRFWKNEAYYNSDNHIYRPSDLDRMQRGLAPQQINPDTGALESMELHHNPPQRDGGLFDVTPLWPSDHDEVDPFRNTGN